MDVQYLSQIIEHEVNIACLIGNGINYQMFPKSVIAWSDLVITLWKETHKSNIIDNIKIDNISLIELAEAAEPIFSTIKQRIREQFSEKSTEIQSCEFLSKLVQRKIPILTTNYDKNIENTLGLKKYFIKGIKGAGFSSQYPWNMYYGYENTKNPLDGFGVWHIHGTIDYYESIRITISDYANLIVHAKEKLKSINNVFSFKGKDWLCDNNWVNIFFNKSICIIGLGLKRDELFLRWLLIERARYIRIHHKKLKGWYLYTDCDSKKKIDDEQKFFLESVNILPICLPSYDDIYKL